MGSRINIYSVQLVRESAKIYGIEGRKITSPRVAAEIVEEVLNLSSKTKENFVIASLNTKNEVTGLHTIHIGTVNSSIVHPRDIFQQLLLNNATAFIAFHNHPSGQTTPSDEDIEVTKRLRDAGQLMGIELMDHVIIGSYGKFLSLKEKGYI